MASSLICCSVNCFRRATSPDDAPPDCTLVALAVALAAAAPAVPATALIAALEGCRAGVVVGSGGARPCQM